MLRLPSLGELDQGLVARIYLCTSPAKTPAANVELKASELAMLLAGIDLTSIKRRKRFARPT